MAKELTEADVAFIDALAEHGSVIKAGEALGFDKKMAYFLARKLKERIIDDAKERLAFSAHKAVNTFTTALDTDGPVHRDRLEAAKQVLDRIGIVKKEEIEIKHELPPVIMLPPKNND